MNSTKLFDVFDSENPSGGHAVHHIGIVAADTRDAAAWEASRLDTPCRPSNRWVAPHDCTADSCALHGSDHAATN